VNKKKALRVRFIAMAQYSLMMKKLKNERLTLFCGRCFKTDIVARMFKCYYCGLVMCSTCAEKHFKNRKQ
jgi:hypothetical protein